MNCGLIFAVLPLLPLGGCERKNYNVISLAPNSLLKALRGTDLSRRSTRPSASRSLIKMKKLLDDGLDLM